MNLKWVKSSGEWAWALQAGPEVNCRNKARIMNNGSAQIWNEGKPGEPMWIPVNVEGLTLEEKKALLVAEYRLQ